MAMTVHALSIIQATRFVEALIQRVLLGANGRYGYNPVIRELNQ
jgi:hypothetical protein